MIVSFQAIQTYVIDAFTLHAASGTRHYLSFPVPYNFILIHFFLLLFCSTCRNVMSTITSRLWIPSVRSSHVQQTWIWERMYDSCMPSYTIRMPCVRPLSSHLIYLTLYSYSFYFIIAPSCYGSMVAGYA
jgi:hypothetical protein